MECIDCADTTSSITSAYGFLRRTYKRSGIRPTVICLMRLYKFGEFPYGCLHGNLLFTWALITEGACGQNKSHGGILLYVHDSHVK